MTLVAAAVALLVNPVQEPPDWYIRSEAFRVFSSLNEGYALRGRLLQENQEAKIPEVRDLEYIAASGPFACGERYRAAESLESDMLFGNGYGNLLMTSEGDLNGTWSMNPRQGLSREERLPVEPVPVADKAAIIFNSSYLLAGGLDLHTLQGARFLKAPDVPSFVKEHQESNPFMEGAERILILYNRTVENVIILELILDGRHAGSWRGWTAQHGMSWAWQSSILEHEWTEGALRIISWERNGMPWTKPSSRSVLQVDRFITVKTPTEFFWEWVSEPGVPVTDHTTSPSRVGRILDGRIAWHAGFTPLSWNPGREKVFRAVGVLLLGAGIAVSLRLLRSAQKRRDLPPV